MHSVSVCLPVCLVDWEVSTSSQSVAFYPKMHSPIRQPIRPNFRSFVPSVTTPSSRPPHRPLVRPCVHRLVHSSCSPNTTAAGVTSTSDTWNKICKYIRKLSGGSYCVFQLSQALTTLRMLRSRSLMFRNKRYLCHNHVRRNRRIRYCHIRCTKHVRRKSLMPRNNCYWHLGCTKHVRRNRRIRATMTTLHQTPAILDACHHRRLFSLPFSN